MRRIPIIARNTAERRKTCGDVPIGLDCTLI
jgi:hypothetical protein